MRFNTVVALVVTAISASNAEAQTATQPVTFEVGFIDEVVVTGTPSLTINTASGGAPAPATAAATWAITTNRTGAKVTGSLDAAMPSGVTLSINLAAPSGATSAGAVNLGTTAANLVTGLSQLTASGLGLTYTLNATLAAGKVASTSRTVTLTVTAGS